MMATGQAARKIVVYSEYWSAGCNNEWVGIKAKRVSGLTLEVK